MRPHKKKIRGDMPPREALRILAPAAAKYILLDWKNLEKKDDKGKLQELKYSQAEALKLLTDPEFINVYEFILEIANNGENYLKEMLEDAKGN